MKKFPWVLVVGVLSILAVCVQTSHTQAPAAGPAPGQPPPGAPAWAYPTPSPDQPPSDANAQVKVPDTTKPAMTMTQVDDLFNAADWFPDQNATMPDGKGGTAPRPDIITKGTPPNTMACGVCHLMSGMGHPESAQLAGLPVNYMVNQMNDFKSGVRKDYARMNGIAAATTPEQWQQAAQWFSQLKPIPWYKVVETDTVPKTYLTAPGRMRLPLPDGGTEPIGTRIIVVPQDVQRVLARDPRIGFIANVPTGSVAKGDSLVNTGGNGKTIQCSICHGTGLKGLGDVPRLAGVHPTYLARQLYNFKSGNSNGMAAVLMKPVAANLTDEDIVDIAAYIANLPAN